MGLKEKVNEGKLCPYCGTKPKFVDSKIVYGISYGMIYYCKDCKAYVGVHKGTKIALGRLADKPLRRAKKKAHFYFDQMWQQAMSKGRSKKEARGSAYKWLSEQMNLPVKETHIGMFTEKQCEQVAELCKPYCKYKNFI